MDDLRALVDDVEGFHDLIEDRKENVLRAIKRDPAKQLEHLLELKPDWKTALACEFACDKTLLSIMLKLGAEPHDPLMSAVGEASARECCELLLQHGADPTYQVDGWTALHTAAVAGLADNCEMLLQRGANPNAVGWNRQTPLNYAAEKGHFECCEVLIQYGANPTDKAINPPLFDALKVGSATCCELLLKHGCDPNELYKSSTPLQVAAMHGFADCCELLLHYGADLGVLNQNKETVLHLAAYSGSVACCEVILQHHGDPNKQDCNGFTPLHFAAAMSFVECCEVLVAYEADPMIKDSKDRLPLYLVKPEDDPTREFLIGHYFDWNAALFRELCEQGKTTVLKRYLDNFRIIPNPPRQRSRVKVYYHDLDHFYGSPTLSIKETPLYQVLNGADDVPSLVDHPVFEHVLNLKWAPFEEESESFSITSFLRSLLGALKFQVGVALSLCFHPSRTCVRGVHGFARHLYISESIWFVILLASTYWSFVSSDNIVGTYLSIAMAVLLLVMEALDWNKRRWQYFQDGTNCINLIAYGGVLVLGVLALADRELPHVTIARSMIIVLLSFCGLEYLRMVPLTSLLIAITFKMIHDVVKFVVLYGVFQVGFSGSFYMLFQDEDSRYNSYSEAFLATFLMLFGDFDSDLFLRLEGAKAVIANTLVFLYLVGAMVMLMNLLIAMMSTSYQEVLDSAKIARSIGRAEMILRMESLLPSAVREYKFYESLDTEEAAAAPAAQVGAIDQGDLKGGEGLPEDVLGRSLVIDQDEADKSMSPLLTSTFNSEEMEEPPGDVEETTSAIGKAAEQRPADLATTATTESSKRASVTEATGVKGPTKTKKLKKRSQKVKNRLRQEYLKPRSGRAQLNDSEVIEFVDGNESVQKDLRQVHEKLETKLEKSQDYLIERLEYLTQQRQQQLQQEIQQQLEQQRQQLQQEMMQMEQRTTQLVESVLAKLNDLERQFADDGPRSAASSGRSIALARLLQCTLGPTNVLNNIAIQAITFSLSGTVILVLPTGCDRPTWNH